MFSIYWYIVSLVIFSMFALVVVYIIDMYDKYQDEGNTDDEGVGCAEDGPAHLAFLNSGYQSLKKGEVERGVDQLAKAVVVAQDDGQLLQAVEKEVPPWTFAKVMQQIDVVRAQAVWSNNHAY